MAAPRKPQDHKPVTSKAFILEDGDAVEPFQIEYHGKAYELIGEITPDLMLAAAEAAKARTEESAAGMIIVFLRDIVPTELRVAMKGSEATKRLFKAWGEHVGLGEGLASAKS